MFERKAKRLGKNLRCEELLDKKIIDYRDTSVAQDEAISI